MPAPCKKSGPSRGATEAKGLESAEIRHHSHLNPATRAETVVPKHSVPRYSVLDFNSGAS